MSEEEYCAVRDLSNVKHAIGILRPSGCGDNSVIQPAELNKMLETLYEWEQALHAQIETMLERERK